MGYPAQCDILGLSESWIYPKKRPVSKGKMVGQCHWFLKIIAKSEIIIAGDGSKTMKLEPLKFTKLN